MGLERLEFGVRVRKFMVISVKTCYRSVWNHPFLFGLVCFLIFLYRSFPLLFSVLVTASPVLVCTAVLLGTLLSFGSPNIPEIDEKEEEQKVSHGVLQLKTGATEDDTVFERDVGYDDFVVERHVGKRWDIVENADEKANLIDNEVSEDEEDDGSVRYKPLVDEDLGSRDILCENGVIYEVEGALNDSLVEKKREIREEMLGSEGVLSMGKAADDQYFLAEGDRNLEVEDGKFKADFSDVPRGDELHSSLVLSWKGVADDDDESLDSGSDGAESSSPDASMADIIPMLDELHPLLGSEAPQPAQLSHDSLDAASERSHGSNNDESVESYELENQGEEDNDDEEDEDEDEDEDEGEGEGAKGDKEDESKSAIKWTEDDQKNLMDMGTSELERNQRLENLIARRRARKNMRLMAEKNLIDLDSADIPLNITTISTTRRNPFELPYDSYDDLGLPPIPGSAPSILRPRRNPFDLPYDSSEEKPDLKGDNFQEEFSGFNQRETVFQREAFFRRHESFNVGSTSLGVPRQELKWKPYFVPEQLVTEGASPSSFQRQSSEVSESKLSSVPDTESVSSVVDEEDNKSYEQDVSQETELIVNEDHAFVHDERESLSFADDSSIIATESKGEVDIINNDVNVHKVHKSEDKLSTNFSSMTSEYTSSPAESPEHTLPTDREDLKDKIRNKIESEGLKEVSKYFNYAAEVYATRVDEENISEEEDEIKEIDEGILSELDTVGDFNVKEIGLPEGSHVSYTEFALLPEDIKTETNVELPVLEARSVEDIDLAFKQLHGVDVEEVILPSIIENQQDHTVTNSKLPVFEARSLEDIHNAFQQGSESNSAELPHSSDIRNGSSEIEQLEAKSVEDTDLAFKQLHEGVDVEKVILPSMIENQQDHVDINSKLPVVEARSLEDIHYAFQQGPESNPAELPHSSDLRNGSSEVEQHDVVSAKEIEVSNVVSGIHENSENAASEPKNEYEEASEKIRSPYFSTAARNLRLCKSSLSNKMSNDAFDGRILTEKLSKLNNSQQSIESLSRWCIAHRKKAKQIVETWDKLFNSSQKEQCVSFLYLANDILQNSRRKGSEFVNEFWKVLPAALKHVYDNGDEYGKKAVTRLVNIWEERKVFGSRGQNLKDEMLGKNPPPPSPPPLAVNNGKSSNPMKIVKRDAHAVRIKLAVGGLPEKILTAYQSVLEDNPNEDTALNKCNAAVQHLIKIGEDVGSSLVQGNQNGSALLDELQKHKNALQQCIEQLENIETTRAALIFQLKEALQEQESKLELIRSQLQVARGQIKKASNVRKRLTLPPVPGHLTATSIPTAEAVVVGEQKFPSAQPSDTPAQPHLSQPMISFAPSKTTEEDSKKAAAAAVAAKLAASTSSAQMLTSVLSSLVAEEAASMNGSLNSSGFTSGLSVFPSEKRPKLEKPMPVSDASNSDITSTAYFSPLQQQTINNMALAPSAGMQLMSQGNQIQALFASAPPPPPPPLPSLSPANPPASQYVQSTGMMVGVMPYGYGANTLPPPPPPLPPHIAMTLARPASQPLQKPQSQPQQQPQSQPQQEPTTGVFYRPPGIGFYGQNPQPTPPVPRQ
ncbi:hypothetical protein CRYUN_Cryun09bG0215500 [Craigia yunnanensis]